MSSSGKFWGWAEFKAETEEGTEVFGRLMRVTEVVTGRVGDTRGDEEQRKRQKMFIKINLCWKQGIRINAKPVDGFSGDLLFYLRPRGVDCFLFFFDDFLPLFLRRLPLVESLSDSSTCFSFRRPFRLRDLEGLVGSSSSGGSWKETVFFFREAVDLVPPLVLFFEIGRRSFWSSERIFFPSSATARLMVSSSVGLSGAWMSSTCMAVVSLAFAVVMVLMK